MKRFFTLLIGLIAIVGTAGADDTWTLRGGFNEWNESANVFSDNTTNVSLIAGTTYSFKIVKNGSTWYTNNATMKWNDCTGWWLNTEGGSDNDCKITASQTGTYTFAIDISAGFPKLTVTFPTSTVYLCNNLGWETPYAYILEGSYWNADNGSGSSGRPNGISMTKIGESNIWKAEFSSPIGDGVMAFLKNIQDNYSNFYNTEAVYRTGYSSETPLFVPSKISSGTFNGTTYYSDGTTPTGEWHAYPTYTRSVTEGNFGTICLPFAATVEGATVFEITSKVVSGENLTGINLTSVEGSLTAGKAYIFKATDATLTATYSGSYSDALTNQDMVGNLSSNTITVPTDGNMYVLGGNKLHKVVTGGSGVTIGQYRGYIDISKVTTTASARGANFIGFEDEQATNINLTTNDILNSDATMYNLAGQRVSENYKGIVVKNGKKFINK